MSMEVWSPLLHARTLIQSLLPGKNDLFLNKLPGQRYFFYSSSLVFLQSVLSQSHAELAEVLLPGCRGCREKAAQQFRKHQTKFRHCFLLLLLPPT